ncbi:Lengsin [Holothuria leucospilota]|uniref:Lengsin n=1 Tax=Holothuria leucospilota TaxID=206669 RepID=A0A9Q1H1T2_HOLLE|nr:Lengsin [Holothuria leucospilota]
MTMSENNQDLLDHCLQEIKEGDIKNVRFELIDLNGIAKSKTITARHFQSLAKSGILLPAGIYCIDSVDEIIKDENMQKYVWSDVMCHSDLTTFTVLPWVKKTARVLVSPSTACNGVQIAVDPRNLALKQLSVLKERNLSILSSFEYEFWVFHAATREPISDGYNTLATLRLAKHQHFFDRLTENLYGAGIDVECVHSEHAFGHFEMPIAPVFGIKSADNATTFRTGVKEMAIQDNYVASFMTKPGEGRDGAGAHLNHSLWSEDGKTPKFSDPSRPYGLSEIGEHWIAGLLAHAPALSLLQAPTLNCRDRLKPGAFAPINATWGVDNRSCAIRWKERGHHGSHVEDRIGSSAGNPYISLAAMIAAGIDGIDRQLPLPKDVPFDKSAQDEKNVPPGTELLLTKTEDALNALLSDKVMVTALGQEFVAFFEGLKRHEMKVFQESTQWGGSKLNWAKKYYFEYI